MKPVNRPLISRMTLCSFVLAMLVTWSTEGFAQADKDEIVQMMHTYVQAFSRSADGAALYLDEPFTVVGPRGSTVAKTRAEAESIYANLLNNLRKEGFARSEYVSMRVKVLTPATAIVSAVAVRYKTDGSEMGRVGSTYVLRKDANGWKIAMVTAHAPDVIVLAE